MAKNEKTDHKQFFKEIFQSLGNYLKTHWNYLIFFTLAFAAVSVVIFFDESTSDTVVSYKLEEFEIGQIADRTIYARKTLAADEFNPISIEEGEKVIRKGFPITETDYKKLKKMSESPVYIDYRAFANKIIFLLLLSLLWFILFSPSLFGTHILLKEVILEGIFFLIIIFAAAFGDKVSFFQSGYALPVIIPSTFCIMIVSILFGRLSAIFYSVLITGAVLCATSFAIIPTLYVMTSSIAAAIIVRDIERRIDLVFASLLVSVVNVVLMIIIKVIFNDTFADVVFVLLGIAFNGFISGILALGFLTPLESILNTASTFRLMDLSDLNTPVMRHLMLQAPGTYSHSLMVATLAERACKDIGANPLIARVGSYYHDIGKMDQPEYFTENQQGENKHNEINPSLSVSVIRSHVKHGVEKAHQLHLPPQIIDIIAEHHGNSLIAYFYNEALKKDPNASEKDYSYSGDAPSSKESAIVMLADTVEAACRTLENPSVPRLEKFIQTLITAKYEKGQLDNSGLTFKDLAIAKDAFVQVLAGYYHSRVKYPNQKDPDAENKDELKTASGQVVEGPSNQNQILGEKTLSEAYNGKQ